MQYKPHREHKEQAKQLWIQCCIPPHGSAQKENKPGLDASVSKKSVYIAVMKDTKEDVTLLSDWPQSKRG